MAKRWYSVSVLSNFEKKIAEQIRTSVAEQGLEDEIDEVLVPTEEVIEVRRGKKVSTERRFMPGYVLVHMEMSDRGYHLINSINRVTGFLGPQGRPMPMRDAEVNRLIFSSSCSIYGDGISPLSESAPSGPTNPYSWSKMICEQMIGQAIRYHSDFRAISLRYFNPIGAHQSGIIGEVPNGIPLNVMPYISQVAIGLREKLSVFGDDYPTPDGTAIRDYIHVIKGSKIHR